MYIFKYENIKKINIELHSYCNNNCIFCLNVFRSSSKKMLKINNENIELILELIKKCINLEIVCLSGHNQPILSEEDLYYINDLIQKIKNINKKILIKICSNSSYIDKINIIDNLNYDLLYLTKYNKTDFDILFSKKYKFKKILFNKYEKTFLIEIENKKIVYKDFSEFCNMKNIYMSNRLDNMGGKFNFLKKNNNKFIGCNRQELFIDYNGNVNICCNTHSDINKKLVLSNIKTLENNICYFLDDDYCKQCTSRKNYISIEDELRSYKCIKQ